MMKLSQLLRVLIIGNPADAAGPAYIKNGTINVGTGVESVSAGGNDIIICNSAASTTATAQLKALRVWGAVWNDVADFQDLNDELVPGKCYVDTPTEVVLVSEPMRHLKNFL